MAQAYVTHSISRLDLFRLEVTNFSVTAQKKSSSAGSSRRLKCVRGARGAGEAL